jgi:hypothetical protein
MAPLAWEALGPARLRADLSMAALYIRYVGLGGVASALQLSDHVASGGPLSMTEHDVVVQAINERFLELQNPERLPYEFGDAAK